MGNTNTIETFQNGAGVDIEKEKEEKFSFFIGLSTTSAVSLAKDFLSSTDNNVLPWRIFFVKLEKLMKDAKLHNDELLRKNYHPATTDYVFKKLDVVDYSDIVIEEEIEIVEEKDAFYTDDSASEDSYGEEDEPPSSKKKKSKKIEKKVIRKTMKRKEVDPSYLSPIFFGYDAIKRNVYLKQKEEERLRQERKSLNAVETAKNFRLDAVTKMEQRMDVQRNRREQKMNDLETKYQNEMNKLQVAYEKEIAGLEASYTTIIKVYYSSTIDSITL
jgi:translation elongation factor EF-1beta